MRKAEREVKDFDEILAILQRCSTLRVAFSAGDTPYIVPVNYGFLAESGKVTLYFHSAREGRKMDLTRQGGGGGRVGFETDRLIEMGQSEKPCGWTSYFESVIGEGTISIVEGDEKKRGMDAVMRHYGFTGPLNYDTSAFQLADVLKIDTEVLSAKRHLPDGN